jgi:hypothetical protein
MEHETGGLGCNACGHAISADDPYVTVRYLGVGDVHVCAPCADKKSEEIRRQIEEMPGSRMDGAEQRRAIVKRVDRLLYQITTMLREFVERWHLNTNQHLFAMLPEDVPECDKVEKEKENDARNNHMDDDD